MDIKKEIKKSLSALMILGLFLFSGCAPDIVDYEYLGKIQSVSAPTTNLYISCSITFDNNRTKFAQYKGICKDYIIGQEVYRYTDEWNTDFYTTNYSVIENLIKEYKNLGEDKY